MHYCIIQDNTGKTIYTVGFDGKAQYTMQGNTVKAVNIALEIIWQLCQLIVED
jgi:hypothetical protein